MKKGRISRRGLTGASIATLARYLVPGVGTLSGPRLFAQDGSKNAEGEGNLVVINLQGGFDSTMFLPTFGEDGSLVDTIDWNVPGMSEATLMEAGGFRLLRREECLTESHPFIKMLENNRGQVNIVTGIDMDGENAHTTALKVLLNGSVGSDLSFTGVFAHLTEGLSDMGRVSFGTQPFFSGIGLSDSATGITIPKQVSQLAEKLAETADYGIDLSLSDNLSQRFYSSSGGSFFSHQGLSGDLAGTFLKQYRDNALLSGAKEKKSLREAFSLDATSAQDLLGIGTSFDDYRYESYRYEAFALCRQMVIDGGIGNVFILNVGMTEGQLGYDTHNAFSNNHVKQCQMLKIDLDAVAKLISGIQAHKPKTTFCIVTEFGRPPRISASGGKDHWGANNTLLFIGPNFEPGVFGTVNPNNYVAAGSTLSDNSVQKIAMRHIYRGFLETWNRKGLFSAAPDEVDRVLRQFFPGPYFSAMFK